MTTCPFCAEEIEDDADICPYCNHPLNATEIEEKEIEPSIPQENKGKSGRLLMLSLIIILGVIAFSKMGFYTVQPIGALPEGVTLLVWRAPGEPFFNSPDAVCLEGQGNLNLLCRGLALGAAPIERIILKMPYMEWAYLKSTGGLVFAR